MSLPTTYADALTYLYGEEGGYTVDAGGPTRWGVTQAVAQAHGYTGDMQAYPIEQAAAVYKPDYWDAVRCDDLPAAVRFAAFDVAVNSGAHEAGVLVQRAAGVAPEDGVVGPATLAAVAALDADVVLRRLCGYRLALMVGLSNWEVESRGWCRRIAAILVA